MTQQRLLLQMLFKAAWVRKDRAMTVLISAAVVAAIATAALTVYFDLESKLSREFRGFGANVVITKQGSIRSDELAKIQSILGEKGEAVPVAYSIGTLYDGTRLVVGGADLAKLERLNSWWSIKRGFPVPHALVGTRVNEKAGESAFAFNPGSGSRAARIVRSRDVLISGSDDDSRIYIPLDEFTRETGIEPNTTLVRVVGRPAEIQNTIVQLMGALPGLEVKPVRQVTQAQTAVVGRTRSLVFAASAVVVVLIMLCLIATLTSSVLERRKDFAVMKALGAPNRTVSSLFAAESALLALAGAAMGFIAGSAIAYWIGKANFGAAILPQPVLLLPVLSGSVIMALLAATAPLRLLQKIQPAGILRGE